MRASFSVDEKEGSVFALLSERSRRLSPAVALPPSSRRRPWTSPRGTICPSCRRERRERVTKHLEAVSKEQERDQFWPEAASSPCYHASSSSSSPLSSLATPKTNTQRSRARTSAGSSGASPGPSTASPTPRRTRRRLSSGESVLKGFEFSLLSLSLSRVFFAFFPSACSHPPFRLSLFLSISKTKPKGGGHPLRLPPQPEEVHPW